MNTSFVVMEISLCEFVTKMYDCVQGNLSLNSIYFRGGCQIISSQIFSNVDVQVSQMFFVLDDFLFCRWLVDR